MPNPPGGLQSLGAIAATEALPLGRAPWNGRGRSTAVGRPQWLHPRALAYQVVALALLAPLHLLQESAPGVRHVWFLVADALAVALAIVIGFISLAYYSGFRGRSLLYVSAGFLGAGLIEMVHVLNILGLDVSLSPAIFTISEDWSSMAARLYLAIMLLAGWRASEGRISPVSTFGLPDRWIFALCSFLLMIFVTVCIYLPRAATLHGHGPAVSIAEVAIGVLYLVVLLIFLRRGDWRSYPFQHWFVLSLILATISQLIYVPLSLDAADPVLLASHAIRLGSYALAFTALLSSTSNLFRQASNAQLEDRIESLIRQHGPATGQDGTKPTGRHKIMDSGAFEIDLATGEFLANNAASEMMNGSDGASAPTTITQCIELLHPEDRSRLIEALRRCQSDGELFKQEFRVPSGEGYCWLEAVGGIEAVDGKPARLLGFINDVSVRKAMELEKDQLYRELEQIITAVDQFAVTATLGLDGNIQATNELFCQFCGREEDELIGRSFSTLLMASQGESPAGDIWQSVCEGKPWQGHVSLCETGGEERIANASLSPHLDDNAEINAFVFIGIDITARAAARRALEVSIEAHRKSNEDLQMFAHIVSHDLQEPLRMVSSFMTLLERRYALELNPEAREFIQFAVEGATRMRSLLDGLLEFSRVQSRSLELKPVDLNASVAGAIANLMVLISERGAEINVTSLPEVQGDAAQLMQLLQNLIANGIKFCRDRSPKMDISAYREDGHWRVRVSDNGIGIEPAHYGKIFQMFQRLHSREEFPGTGVGLAVCKRIMERHGGSIEVESLQGQGSTFTLIF